MNVMRTAIDFDRLEHGRRDDTPYTRAEVKNAIATIGALMVLACPFRGRSTIFAEMAALAERVKKG